MYLSIYPLILPSIHPPNKNVFSVHFIEDTEQEKCGLCIEGAFSLVTGMCYPNKRVSLLITTQLHILLFSFHDGSI